MDTESKVSDMYHLLCWGRRHENPLFNPHFNHALDVKEKLRQNFRSTVTMSRNFKPVTRPTAVQTQFQLAPVVQTQDIEPQTTPGRSDDVKHHAVTEVNVMDVIRRWHMCSVQKRKTSFASALLRFGIRTPPPLRHEELPIVNPGVHELQETSSGRSMVYTPQDTPLPIFLRRSPTKELLLRRPTIDKVLPLPVDNEHFVGLSKHIDLKALPFKKTAESFKFYETHYPLILTKVSLEGERCVTPSKRSRTPESPMSLMIQRQRTLNMRLIDLEYMMEDMERGTEDCEFVTELYSDTFNPTLWKWNKVDVTGLRRRYTIDASLREMR